MTIKGKALACRWTSPLSCHCSKPRDVTQAIDTSTVHLVVVNACHLKRTAPSCAPRIGGDGALVISPTRGIAEASCYWSPPSAGLVILIPTLTSPLRYSSLERYSWCAGRSASRLIFQNSARCPAARRLQRWRVRLSYHRWPEKMNCWMKPPGRGVRVVRPA